MKTKTLLQGRLKTKPSTKKDLKSTITLSPVHRPTDGQTNRRTKLRPTKKLASTALNSAAATYGRGGGGWVLFTCGYLSFVALDR